MTTDNLTREVRRLDPVGSGELREASEGPEAADLLERILSLEFDPTAHPLHPDGRPRDPVAYPRRRRARRRGSKLMSALVAAGVVAFLLGSSAGGGGGRSADAVGTAAAAAVARGAGGSPFNFSKTREVAVIEAGAGGRSWSVYEPTTREEWVGPDGAGRLRVITGPSRFVGHADRAAWEAAGHPGFLALGFGRRTEDRWLAGGLRPQGVEELPLEPRPLATRIRYEAELESGSLSVPAATLQRIADDLRDPASPPRLRRSLYLAARLVPGTEYLGEEVDPVGRSGVGIGVPGTYAGGPARYSLIFDPETSAVLATETTSLPAVGSGGAGKAKLVRARAYLESRGVGSEKEFAKTWLGGPEPGDATAGSLAAFLVYRMPQKGTAR
jgi:hypothetical protein